MILSGRVIIVIFELRHTLTILFPLNTHLRISIEELALEITSRRNRVAHTKYPKIVVQGFGHAAIGMSVSTLQVPQNRSYMC